MRFLLRLALPGCLGAGAAVFGLFACSDDGGTSFGPNYGDLPQHGSGDAAADGDIVEIRDGSTDGPTPGCTTGSVAILSGDNDKLIASVDRGRGFAVALLTGGAALSVPALAPYGDGFVGVTRGGGNTLQWTQYGTAWTKPAQLSAAGIVGAPTLAANDTSLHLVYPSNDQMKFQHTTFDGNAWAADELVRNPAAAPTAYSFGTDSAGIAVTASDLAWGENGSDHGLYVRSRANAWSDATAVSGAGTNGYVNQTSATPQILAIEGSYDAIMFFVGGANEQVNHVGYVQRKAADKTWVFGALLDTTLETAERVNVARTRAGDVLVTMRTKSGSGYLFQGTVAADTGVTFGQATPIGGDTAMTVDSTPAVAKGVCGADAVMAVSSVGKIQILRLEDGAWTAPETIDGAAGYHLAIATRGQ